MAKRKLIIGVIILIVIAAGGFLVWQKPEVLPFLGAKFGKDSYQAVFLSNGQVYFGRVKNISRQYATLTDIFYLISKQPVQEVTGVEGQEGTVTPGARQLPEYTLIKLGQELHGPVDEMVINRDHILFIEELKEDSKVVTTIKDFKAGRIPTVTPTPMP